MVDTCAAEFRSSTPYYYGTYETENESIVTDRRKILVLGSGPIRIGQGVRIGLCDSSRRLGNSKSGTKR
ncbi:hypothetical protein ACVNP1_12030 [Staphylococcus aureus]